MAGRNEVVDGVVMTCQEFLARHSEYVDEVMGPEDSARWREHVAVCSTCARYDRVVRRTPELVQELSPVEPSSDFFPRLQHRIYNLEDSSRMGDPMAGASALVSLAVAGALALLAWSPLLRTSVWPGWRAGGVAEQPASGGATASRAARTDGQGDGATLSVQLAAEAGATAAPVADTAEEASAGPRIVPMQRTPDALDAWWWNAAPAAAFDRAPSVLRTVRSVDLHVPGPYSPLVVGAPAHRPASVVRRVGVQSNR